MRRQLRRLVVHSWASLSVRLMVPVLLAVIPLLLVARYQIDESRDRTLEQAEAALAGTADAIAVGDRLIVQDTSSVLVELSTRPRVLETGPLCQELLGGLAGIDLRFANLAVAAPNGDIVCSALPIPPGTNIADRSYFIDAMRTNDMAHGSFQIGRITGVPSINIGYPLRDESGDPIGIIFAAISLAFLQDQLDSIELPAGGSAIVFDQTGTILMHSTRPELVGDPGYRLSLSMLETDPEMAIAPFFDEPVLLATRQLSGGVVVVARPRAAVVAPAIDESRALILVGVAAALFGSALAFGLTWAGVARPITRIRAAVRELARGDLSIRLNPPSRVGTLDGLSADVDEMAAALETTQGLLRRYAFEDPVTALPNRRALLVRMTGYPSGALIYVRLDSLADIASMLGYEAADQAVKAVAGRLMEVSEEPSLVARVSDASLALFCPTAVNREDVRQRMSRIIQAVGGSVDLDEVAIDLVARVGAALSPEDATDPETLMRLAELAARGPDRSDRGTLFNALADRQKAENLRLLAEMRAALESDSFDLAYQPIVAIQEQREPHFEALIRWRSADGELRAPGEFIPLAERTGVIGAIDRWVLDRVGRQLQTWRADGFEPSVSVNLSAHSLLNEDLPAYVGSVIEQYGLAPGQLKVEITETAFLEGFDGPMRVCEALKGLGVAISVDDFGMGYSPLQYLRTFPVGTLKMDMSLIRDVDGDPMVASVIQGIVLVATRLDLRTVAEGVETATVHALVRRMGVTDAQGYYYARPMPPDAARRWAAPPEVGDASA